MSKTLQPTALTRALLVTIALALCLATGSFAQTSDTSRTIQTSQTSQAPYTLADDIQSADPVPVSDALITYWGQHREGWFWYRDPVPPKPRPPATPQKRPKDLSDFDALQQRLEDLKRLAVMNPTDTNLLAYMRLQRAVMDKSQVFAERWQRLVWSVPDLDYGMTGRPTNALAINVFDDQQRERDAQSVRALAASHGLIFVFRSDCPFCHRFAPFLKRFEQEFGITVLAVSMDGGTLPDYPDARPDNGIATRLQARSVPALYLTQPSRREIRPVGFGLMSDSELLERVAALARDPPTTTTTPANPGRPQR